MAQVTLDEVEHHLGAFLKFTEILPESVSLQPLQKAPEDLLNVLGLRHRLRSAGPLPATAIRQVLTKLLPKTQFGKMASLQPYVR